MEEWKVEGETHTSEIKLRENPRKRREKVRVGCGAGFGGDRPRAALKLLQRVEGLDYLVLECLAERTLADRYQIMMEGGVGYDPRIGEWMSLLLPLAVEKGVCLITNMGAVNPHGAQEEVLNISRTSGLNVVVALAYEIIPSDSGVSHLGEERDIIEGAASTYVGAAPIVECLEKYNPNVIITSRVADAALFLGPMVYELGWNWDDFQLLAKGSLAGHLLECGCQLTGGYFMHPGDKNRVLSFQKLLDLSLPFAEVSSEGEVSVAKADGSGGLLNYHTCAEQLLYEVGDPHMYVTPDVVIDFQDVTFYSLSQDRVLCFGAKPSKVPVPDKLLQLVPKVSGWKGWGEISYGGYECVKRAEAAKFLVSSWMEEAYPGTGDCIASYMIGLDSLKVTNVENNPACSGNVMDVRLRMDGRFELKEHAVGLANEFMALYTNGPASGGGISTGYKKEMILLKRLVGRETVFWKTEANHLKILNKTDEIQIPKIDSQPQIHSAIVNKPPDHPENDLCTCGELLDNFPDVKQQQSPAPSNEQIVLYEIAHSRAGDKGNDLNFSVIPYFAQDMFRLKKVITSQWVLQVMSALLDTSSFPELSAIRKGNAWINDNVTVEIFDVRGIHSLNVVVRNILDGGVNCSRRIDRHGKTISDLVLCQEVVLPRTSDN